MKNLTAMKSLSATTALSLMMVMLCARCESCFKTGAIREANVANCDVHAGQEGPCNAATVNGVRCEFDKATGDCRASSDRKAAECEKMTKEDCEASKFCTYLDMTASCTNAEPALSGKCDIIQDKISCTADNSCAWNDTALVCEQKK